MFLVGTKATVHKGQLNHTKADVIVTFSTHISVNKETS